MINNKKYKNNQFEMPNIKYIKLTLITMINLKYVVIVGIKS